ncbi:hypothetical protein HKD37_17G048027 [Glycine soja]
MLILLPGRPTVPTGRNYEHIWGLWRVIRWTSPTRIGRRRHLISQRLLTVGRKGSYCRPWGRDGGSLNQTSQGNGPLQPIRTVSRTLSVRNTASARKSGPSFSKLAETLLRRYVLCHLRCAQEGTDHPEAEYYPPRFVSWGL